MVSLAAGPSRAARIGGGVFFGCMGIDECRAFGFGERGKPLDTPVIPPAPDAGHGPCTHLVDLGYATASPPAIDALR